MGSTTPPSTSSAEPRAKGAVTGAPFACSTPCIQEEAATVSDPNLNDASESVESVDDELDIVEGADVVDEFEAADAAAA